MRSLNHLQCATPLNTQIQLLSVDEKMRSESDPQSTPLGDDPNYFNNSLSGSSPPSSAPAVLQSHTPHTRARTDKHVHSVQTSRTHGPESCSSSLGKTVNQAALQAVSYLFV